MNEDDEFEWDDAKNETNFRKHGLRFEEIVIIFSGPHITELDTRSYDEDRYITIGLLTYQVIVVVAHTSRNGRNRIISARHATPRERKRFYEKVYRRRQ
jgi:uncharacterized DUF497 family protein